MVAKNIFLCLNCPHCVTNTMPYTRYLIDKSDKFSKRQLLLTSSFTNTHRCLRLAYLFTYIILISVSFHVHTENNLHHCLNLRLYLTKWFIQTNHLNAIQQIDYLRNCWLISVLWQLKKSLRKNAWDENDPNQSSS